VSAQRLNARSIRRIERAAGCDVLRAWSHGGYVFPFVTPDHWHGVYDKKTGDVEWFAEGERVWCYSTCRELPPLRYGRPPRRLVMLPMWPREVHEISTEGPIAYPGGKDGSFRAVCSCGRYWSGYARDVRQALKDAAAHVEAKR
jgi:hypothetical protein